MSKPSLAIAYSMKKKKMASGGTVKSGDPTMNYAKGGTLGESPWNEESEEKMKGQSLQGAMTRQATENSRKGTSEAYRVGHSQKGRALREAVGTLVDLKKSGGPTSGKSGFAEGGEVDPMMEVTCPHCTKTFSHGGEVANDTGEGAEADMMPNQFDDLVLDDSLEDESGPGNEMGNEGEDKRRADLVMRAMMKRKVKK